MENIPPNDFPQRLKQCREIRGFSQTSLAKKADVPPSAISHFEAGERKPSFETLRRLADTLAVTIDYLLGRIDETEGLMDADPLYRGFQELNDEDRKFMRDFMQLLRKRRADHQSEADP